MAAIRFFTDEDVYGAIATALRRVKIDACSTSEASRGTKGRDKGDILLFL